YGALVLVMGSAGVIVSPWLDRWLRRRGYADSPVRVAVIAACGLVVVCSALAAAPTYGTALMLAGCTTFFYSLPQTTAAVALQLATPNRIRAMFTSLYVFINSVMGLGVAPTLVAVLTDYVLRDPKKLGVSLSITCVASSVAAACLIWQALRHYGAAMERARI